MENVVHNIVESARKVLAIRLKPRVRILNRIHSYRYYDTTISIPNFDDWYNNKFLGSYSKHTNKYLNF